MYLISMKAGVLKAIMTDTVALKQKILPGLYLKVEWKKPSYLGACLKLANAPEMLTVVAFLFKMYNTP